MLVAVDDQHGWACKIWRTCEIERQPALAVMQFDQQHTPPSVLDSRHQRGQQCRFAGAVRSDDLAPPAAVAQAIDQLVSVFVTGEEKGQCSGPGPVSGEGIFADWRLAIVVHGV